MANFTTRTLDTIFTNLLTYKDTIPELTGLNTTIANVQDLLDKLQSDSSVSIWVMELYIVAYSQWVLENIIQTQVNEIETIKNAALVGTFNWYSLQATKFQYPDNITVDSSTDFVPKYSLIDAAKQIVAQASALEVSGKLILKIRGRDNDVLTTPELNAFITYINKIKFVGTKIAIQNIESDKLKLIATIKYNGESNINDLKNNVTTAIDNYLLNLPFNSALLRNKLIDEVQNIDGVIDIEIDTLQARPNSISSFVNIQHRYNSLAGYIRIDDNFELDTFLTYEIE